MSVPGAGRPALYRKALVAFAAALATALGYAAPDGLTAAEVLLGLGAALTAGGAVYGVPNDDGAPAGGDTTP